MQIFASQTNRVDLGDGNTVVLRKLSFKERIDCGESLGDDSSVGAIQYALTVRSIESWGGPAFIEFPKPTEEACSRLGSEFFEVVAPKVMELLELTTEEGEE